MFTVKFVITTVSILGEETEIIIVGYYKDGVFIGSGDADSWPPGSSLQDALVVAKHNVERTIRLLLHTHEKAMSLVSLVEKE